MPFGCSDLGAPLIEPFLFIWRFAFQIFRRCLSPCIIHGANDHFMRIAGLNFERIV